jgi:hypothetical protein
MALVTEVNGREVPSFWLSIPEGADLRTATDLPTILSRLTYEERECERCLGMGVSRVRYVGGELMEEVCPICHGIGTAPPPPEVLEFARELGL